MITLAVPAAETAAQTAWMTAAIGVLGALLGTALTGWWAYRRELRLRRIDHEHALALRERERRDAAADAKTDRRRTAYLELLAAVSETSALRVEWEESRDPSSKTRKRFLPAGLLNALGSAQLAVPADEAEAMGEVIKEFRLSHWEMGQAARTALLELYRTGDSSSE